jgi:hypothetical protein
MKGMSGCFATPIRTVSALYLLCLIAFAGAWASDNSGAATDRWWSRPPGHVALPDVDPEWVQSPIDAFIRAAQQKRGLRPAPAADKRTLLRRVTFDLIGLPPTPDEINAFLAGGSADAWRKVVERLLASPHYGERWARHWLDVVRYADTSGFENDHLYPSAWKYRDYIIRSFSANKSIDRFIQEQVAGDELWPNEAEAVLATSLYSVGPAMTEAAMVSNQLEYEWLTDAADTTGAAFLGLTFGCARCHNHKYDPISQHDYYGMQAIFAASDRPFPDKIRVQRIKALNGLLSDAPVPKELLNDPRCTVKTEEQVGFRLFHRHEPLPVRRLERGELSKPAEMVEPSLPENVVVGSASPLVGVPPDQRRLTLAHWLTAPDNSLTARVFVNRVWGWHFGQGLVRTPNDFGAQGEPPTHLDLLDWLARDFIDHGWDMKRLHRQILLSSTYQMQSVATPEAMATDPQNRSLSHFPRRRLEGEAVRDALLACSGALNTKQFGPPVVPPLSGDELTGLFDARGKWQVTKEKSEHTRRSIYVLVRRTFVYPLFAAFDPPEVMTSCPKRLQTIVPTQALALLNSPVSQEQAAVMARRLIAERRTDKNATIERAWQLVFGRPPKPNEADYATAFLDQRASELQSGDAALAELCLALFNSSEFIYLD